MDGGEKPGEQQSYQTKQTSKQRLEKRLEKMLHNTQGKNPSRSHKNYRLTCTQHRRTQIYNENLGGLQERH